MESGTFADRPGVLKRMELVQDKLESHGRIAEGEACDLAVEIGEAADAMITEDTWVGSVPLGKGPPFIQFARCRDETTSVVMLRRAVADIDEATVRLVLSALDELS